MNEEHLLPPATPEQLAARFKAWLRPCRPDRFDECDDTPLMYDVDNAP